MLVVAAGSTATWWWLQRDAGGSALEVPTYVAPNLGPYQLTIPAPGTLRSAATAEVRTERASSVLWTAPVGTRVEVGDVVARLDATDAERDVRDAELALERSERALLASRSDLAEADRSLVNALLEAERRVARARLALTEAEAHLTLATRLAEVGAIAPRELHAARDAYQAAAEEVELAERGLTAAQVDVATRQARAERDLADAEAAFEAASLRLERARSALEGAVLYSSLDGIVSEVRVPGGGFANNNATVLVLADDQRLELVAQVDESEVGLLAVGQRAAVSASALGEHRLTSSVASIAPVARTSQNIPVFEVVLSLDNPDGLLRPGMTAEAHVVVRHEVDTVTLPSAALTFNPRGEGVVSVRDEAGEITRTPVEVIAAAGTSVVVRGEFAEGIEIEIPAAAPVAVAPTSVAGPTAPATSPGIIPAITGGPAGSSSGTSGSGGGAGRGGGQ